MNEEKKKEKEKRRKKPNGRTELGGGLARSARPSSSSARPTSRSLRPEFARFREFVSSQEKSVLNSILVRSNFVFEHSKAFSSSARDKATTCWKHTIMRQNPRRSLSPKGKIERRNRYK